MINQINASEQQWEVIGFFDDGLKKNTMVAGCKVRGGVDEINKVGEQLAAVIAVGNPALKREIHQRISNERINFPTLIHPAVTLGQNIKIGVGCILAAGCRLTIDITLHDFVLLNLNTTIGHDVSIGSFSSVMPGVHLSGYVQVGEEVLIGTGTSVLQNVTIAHKAVIGAGAVVNRSVEVGRTVAGVPARVLKKND